VCGGVGQRAAPCSSSVGPFCHPWVLLSAPSTVLVAYRRHDRRCSENGIGGVKCGKEDGCEGINDLDYRAPGEEFLRPMADFFRAIPFWRMAPNFTACVADDPAIIQAALATPERDWVLAYLCAAESGQAVSGATVRLRLTGGRYRITFRKPADGSILGEQVHQDGRGAAATVPLPDFTDGLVVLAEKI
jgi:hypothetical protein